jgi:hypothetical protein
MALSDAGAEQRHNVSVAMIRRWRRISAVSTKFEFNEPEPP